MWCSCQQGEVELLRSGGSVVWWPPLLVLPAPLSSLWHSSSSASTPVFPHPHSHAHGLACGPKGKWLTGIWSPQQLLTQALQWHHDLSTAQQPGFLAQTNLPPLRSTEAVLLSC